MGGADWGELALVSRVDQWVAAHPYFFMISRARLVRPTRAQATVTGLAALRSRDAIVSKQPEDLARVPTGAFRIMDLNKSKTPTGERGGRPTGCHNRIVQAH